MPEEPIKIDGLKQFRKELKEVEASLPRALRLAFNNAAQLIVDDAKPLVPHNSGAAQGSIRVLSTQTKARVAAGGSKVPYYPWLDFGGRVGKYDQVKRPFYKEGRYIYKAYGIRKADGSFQEVMVESLQQIANDAGLDMEIK